MDALYTSNIPPSTQAPLPTAIQVGVKALQHPMRIFDKLGGEQQTVATFDLSVTLKSDAQSAEQTAITSRFIEILEAHTKAISAQKLVLVLQDLTDSFQTDAARIEMRFPYFIKKTAPVSGVESLLDYDVSFIGERKNDFSSISVRIEIPVTTLNPESKALAARGAVNQRCLVTLNAQVRGFIWLEELIALVEQQASCELYGVLKRPDEKYVTEQAYDNPMSAQDLVRQISQQLRENPKILDFSLTADEIDSSRGYIVYARNPEEGE